MQFSVSHAEFGHFSFGDIDSKYNIISHRKSNFYDNEMFNKRNIILRTYPSLQ